MPPRKDFRRSHNGSDNATANDTTAPVKTTKLTENGTSKKHQPMKKSRKNATTTTTNSNKCKNNHNDTNNNNDSTDYYGHGMTMAEANQATSNNGPTITTMAKPMANNKKVGYT